MTKNNELESHSTLSGQRFIRERTSLLGKLRLSYLDKRAGEEALCIYQGIGEIGVLVRIPGKGISQLAIRVNDLEFSDDGTLQMPEGCRYTEQHIPEYDPRYNSLEKIFKEGILRK